MKTLIYLALFLFPVFLLGQDAEDQLYKVVEEMPLFPGCEDQECSQQQLLEYVYKNLKYPETARKNKVEGMVVIQFVIDKEGNVKDPKLVRDIGSGCGDAALHVVSSMRDLVERDTLITFNDNTYEETFQVTSRELKWKPGIKDGKAVDVLYTLPVKYKLQDETPEESNSQLETEITAENSWIVTPPEYQSFQVYKTKVLIPEQVKLAFKVDPIESSKVVGDIIPYGQAMHPLLKVMGTHNGIDFRAVPGVPVMASADAVVLSIETEHEKYGQAIKLRHNERSVSLYAHLSAIDVKVGQKVKAGQQIGAVGQSGTASYPHLHYELYINGQTENPILDTRGQNYNASINKSIRLKSNKKTDLNPLLVVDGVQQKSDFDIKSIDPNDIATMHVLKGEKAFDKYGSIAENGVIEIVMKVNESLLKTEKTVDLTAQFELQQNAPNPVFDQTKISFHLPNDRPASLLFYNQSGEFVYGIKDDLQKGYNEVSLTTDQLNTTGIIYYFLIQDQMTATKKMIILE